MADPTFTGPADGATLDGAIQLFSWDLGGVPIESAWLYIGATEGGSQYLSRWVGTATATSAGDLPIDGSAVHGRLWYRLGGVWSFIDRRWVAATSPGLPTIVEPVAGAKLEGDVQVFRWDTASLPVENSWLYVGSTLGASDHAALHTATDRQVTVGALPRDESTIHARLYFRVGGIWYFVDETYEAAADPGPTRDELVRELQALVGVSADGDIGPITERALNHNWVGHRDSFDPSFAARLTNDEGVVRWVQRRLIARGGDLVADGDFGPGSEAVAVADLGRGGVVAAESFVALLDPAI
jgi:peptidoglycan hydrolase-like protein with peptidoglycan-binding domain